MKKICILFTSLFFIYFISCSQDGDNNIIENGDNTELPANSEKVIGMLNDFRSLVNDEPTKSLKTSPNILSIDVKKINIDLSLEGQSLGLTKSGNENQEVEMYTLLFEEGESKGYFIACPDDRIQKVYAYTEHGELSDTLYNIGLRFALNDIKDICKDDLVNYYVEENTSKTKAARPTSKITTGNLLPIAWDQISPYNGQAPLGCNNDAYKGRSAAGCGAISVAQALVYYGKNGTRTKASPPSIAGLVRTDFNYSSLGSQEKITTSSSSTLQNEVARFVNTVGVLHKTIYRCASAGGSSTQLTDAELVFKDFGGSNWNTSSSGYLKYVEGALDQCKVYGLFMSNNIMLSRGYSSSVGGHVWVYSGMNFTRYNDDWSMKSVDQLYANWGWGGNSNGYFAFNNAARDFTSARAHLYRNG